jgi:hypothetical protein
MRGRALIALPLLVAAGALGSDAPPQRHIAWCQAALSRLPLSKADHEPARAKAHAQNLTVFAQEIARVSVNAPLPPRQWSSLLGAIGGIESNFDTDTVAGRCPPNACDHGLAKGAFQNQNVGPVRDLWPIADGNPPVQVAMADRMMRRTWQRCAPFAPFPASAFRGYAGHSCSWPVHREAERVAAYLRLMNTPAVTP